MFSKDNIKFNIFFYMLIFLGWAFISDGELPSFAAYFSTLLYLLRYLLIHYGS